MKVFELLSAIFILTCFFACKEKVNAQSEAIYNNVSTIQDCSNSIVINKYILDLSNRKIDNIFNTTNNSYDEELWRIIDFNRELSNKFDKSSINRSLNVHVFSEQFDWIFPTEYIICLKSINFNKLFFNGKFITKNHYIRDGGICRIISTFDKTENKVRMILLYEFLEDGDKYETSINYVYTIRNCDIRMTDIRLIN